MAGLYPPLGFKYGGEPVEVQAGFFFPLFFYIGSEGDATPEVQRGQRPAGKRKRKYQVQLGERVYNMQTLEEVRSFLSRERFSPAQKRGRPRIHVPKIYVELQDATDVTVRGIPLVQALRMDLPLLDIEQALQSLDDEEEAILLLM